MIDGDKIILHVKVTVDASGIDKQPGATDDMGHEVYNLLNSKYLVTGGLGSGCVTRVDIIDSYWENA